MIQELPEPLQMAAVDLAEWLVSQKLNVGTCHGAAIAIQRLADERPHMAEFLENIHADDHALWIDLLERADSYRQMISAIQGVNNGL